MVQPKIESGQEQGPSGLSTVELLGSHEVLEVFVIGPNLKLVLSPFYEVPPLFHGSDDRQHFLVMDLVVSLNWGQ